jgi:Chalcone isomerase-like
MSASTRSSASERADRLPAAWLPLAFALSLAVTAVSARAVDAPPLPSQVLAIAPNLKVQGGGELTFFGISVYDGYYWSPTRGWTQDGPFALDLHYHRALDGAKIAERSVSEIAKLGYGTLEQRARWGEEMRRTFPDVRRGDRLTGVNLPGGVVRYFHNGKSIGEIADPGFARAFFGIWLDPKTSELDFRQLLLGEKP